MNGKFPFSEPVLVTSWAFYDNENLATTGLALLTLSTLVAPGSLVSISILTFAHKEAQVLTNRN